MTKYTEGIAGDTTIILKDGVPVPISDILSELNRIEELELEIKEYGMSFDLRWKSDMRAIKRWQEETGESTTWPDHTDLSIWLLRALEKSVFCGRCGEEKISHCTNACGT